MGPSPGVPTTTKQTYIYKKNTTSATNKAITRKLRQSQAPQTIDTGAAGATGAITDGGKNTLLEDARTSQNEAETIATQGNASGVSPRGGQALSQGHFNRLDSEVIATSDV